MTLKTREVLIAEIEETEKACEFLCPPPNWARRWRYDYPCVLFWRGRRVDELAYVDLTLCLETAKKNLEEMKATEELMGSIARAIHKRLYGERA